MQYHHRRRRRRNNARKLSLAVAAKRSHDFVEQRDASSLRRRTRSQELESTQTHRKTYAHTSSISNRTHLSKSNTHFVF